MPEITVYTGQMCPYCTAAKRLLDDKGANYREIDVTFDPAGRKAMTARAGGATSVPQIFIGEKHVGGCDQLYALERSGGLDPLLKSG